MKLSELKEDARTLLSQTFKGKVADPVPQPHVLHAAINVLMMPPDPKE